jgi:glycosyltransferase involved in cell wall biosynthesis
MLRIVTVYTREPTDEDARRQELAPVSMAYIRWFRITEELAALGHQVDMAVADAVAGWPWTPRRAAEARVRRVPLSKVRWQDYDVVKTDFHRGFTTLEAYGGAGHPFIVSKLGSVVGPRDMEGVHFYGETRRGLHAIQERIARTSRYVTVLSPQARALWHECHGGSDNTLLVPGAVDREIPARGADPYPADARTRVLFAGNIYNDRAQPEANVVLSTKLNELGRHLSRQGARLYMLGTGDVSRLDPEHVTYLGAVDYAQSWDYLLHAGVGIVVTGGTFSHNNESTKIYHYLRAGIPVVSEAGFPNDAVVTESGLGTVAANGDMEAMAAQVIEASRRDWDREAGIRYILERHTWDRRAETYAALLARHFPRRAA